MRNYLLLDHIIFIARVLTIIIICYLMTPRIIIIYYKAQEFLILLVRFSFFCVRIGKSSVR